MIRPRTESSKCVLTIGEPFMWRRMKQPRRSPARTMQYMLKISFDGLIMRKVYKR